MKFNVEIELDWVEENGTIDEEIKDQIIGSVSREIKQSIDTDAVKNAVQSATDRAISCVDKSVQKEVSVFLKRKVVITDSYGDPKGKPRTIRQIIKEKFDKMMTETVDEDGKVGGYGKQPRLDWLLDGMVKKHVSKETRCIESQISKQVKEQVNEAIKNGLSESVKELMKKGLNGYL